MKQIKLSSVILAKDGQALIVLIVAIALSISILTAVVISSIGLGKNISRGYLGKRVYHSAETGADYALIKLARNPNCSGTDTFTIDSANVTVTYTDSGGDCIVESTAQESSVIKTIQVQASYSVDHIFNYCCWVEKP